MAALLPTDLGEGEVSFLVVTPPVCWDCFQTCSPLCPTHSCCALALSLHLNQVQARC